MMRMRDIDDFLPQMRSFAPSVPDPLAYIHMRNAAREFCQKTQIWKENDRIEVSAPDGQGVCGVQDSEIVAIHSAKLNGHPLEPVTQAWLDERYPEWTDEDPDVGSATYIVHLYENVVSVAPRANGALSCRLVLKPSADAMTLPAILHADHGEHLARGAAGLLMLTPNTEFHNPSTAGSFIGAFNAYCDTQKMKVARSKVGGKLRTKGSYF